MASEIRVNKINSRTGVGTITLSPTGVDFTGIATAATLRATTGIVTSLTAGSLTSLGAVSGTTGTFTGDVDVADKIVHTGDTDTAIRFPASGDTFTVETGGSERVRVDSSGNLGINNASPGTKLAIGDGTIDSSNVITFGKRVAGTNSNLPVIGHHSDGSGSGIAICATSSGGKIHFFTGNGSAGFGSESNVEAMRVDHNGQLGIGTASPAGLLHISKSGGNAKLLIQRSNTASNTNDYGSILWRSSAGNNNALIGAARHSAENDAYMFFSTASGGSLQEELRIQSSGGISFNGDTAQANALDDYEEGTWTPTFTGSTTNPVYSTSTVAGNYTKIGNTVTAWALIIVNGVTSNGSGNWRISGFPFTSSGTTYSQVGIIGYNDVLTNEVNKLYISNSNNHATIIPNGVTQSNETYNNNAITTGYFTLTMTYSAT